MQPAAGELALLVAVIAYLIVGALLVARRPSQPIGWIFAASALLMLLGVSSVYYSEAALARDQTMTPVLGLAVWVSAWFWPLAFAGMTAFTFLLFPTGRPLNRNWAIVGWVAAVGFGGSALLYSVSETVCGGSDSACDAGTALTVENPIGLVADGSAQAIESVLFLIGALASVAAVVSLVVRFRRTEGIERSQLKWITFAGLLVVIFAGVGTLLDLVNPALEQTAMPIFAVSLALIPVSVGIALFRYRLYEIDRLINRTLVYGLVVASLVVVYAGAVVLLQLVLPERGDLAVAASTLAVAALFNPLRIRVQRFVDRRFYRSRYDAERVAAEFAVRLRDEVDIEELTTDWLDVVHQTVQPASVSVWVKGRR